MSGIAVNRAVDRLERLERCRSLKKKFFLKCIDTSADYAIVVNVRTVRTVSAL